MGVQGMHPPTRPKEVLTWHLISLKTIAKIFLYCTLLVLQACLPVTTRRCTENKLVKISSSLKQLEQIQKKDYSQSKLIVKSADLTENGYPRTLTSSHPSGNVTKTSAEVTRRAVAITWCGSRSEKDDETKGENPSTDNHLKVLEIFEISQSPGDSISNSQLEHLK